MKLFVLTAMRKYGDSPPILIIPAGSRAVALKKLKATAARKKEDEVSGPPIVIPEEVRKKRGLPYADSYLLFETPFLSS